MFAHSQLSEEVGGLVEELVDSLTNFEINSPPFRHCKEYILSHLLKNPIRFADRKSIDASISGLSEKFAFHGFGPQASELLRLYEKFKKCSGNDDNRLGIIRLFISLSESPTKRLLEFGFEPTAPEEPDEPDSVDWGSYLKEGIERWTPEMSSDSESTEEVSEEVPDVEGADPEEVKNLKVPLENPEMVPELNYSDLVQSIRTRIQPNFHSNPNLFRELPESTNIDATITLNWEGYVEHETHGMFSGRTNIVSEYKSMRELIWEFWVPGVSASQVTVASVRPAAFEGFRNEFRPALEVLESFRGFKKSLEEDSEVRSAPGIYRTYVRAVEEIIEPMYRELIEIEREVLEQKTTMTLLKIAGRLREHSENLLTLKRIHDRVILDFNRNTSSTCAMNLLCRLHYDLLHSTTSKTEFDIHLTLYVGSLFRYIQIADSWFRYVKLVDLDDEFPIQNSEENTSLGGAQDICFFEDCISDSDTDSRSTHVQFAVRKMDELATEDSILKILTKEVLQIGKNMGHVKMLRRLHLLGKDKESVVLYDDFVERLLKKICDYFQTDFKKLEINKDSESEHQINYKFPAIDPDSTKYATEMDQLEMLVDTSNKFLMKAFESFFKEKKPDKVPREPTLFERIAEVTRDVCPVEPMLAEAFSEAFRNEYPDTGSVVRTLLVAEHRLEEHFELLQHLFLFKDNVLVPWYQRFFAQMDEKQVDSDVWLTMHLHDILIDSYPELYERCLVKASDMWNLYEDPLKACGVVGFEYRTDWPVSMIITKDQIEMYKHVFRFTLQIKWALWTLNRMYFDEIEPKVKISKQHKAVTILLRRLKVYRFWLINDFTKLQHFVIGNLFVGSGFEFRSKLSESCNLDSIYSCHAEFINKVFVGSTRLWEENHNSYGFNYLLYLVSKLRLIWSNLKNVDDRELAKFEKSLKTCRGNLDRIMFPEIE